MSAIGVHPRVSSRHPEVTDNDVVAAMRGMIRYKQTRSPACAGLLAHRGIRLGGEEKPLIHSGGRFLPSDHAIKL